MHHQSQSDPSPAALSTAGDAASAAATTRPLRVGVIEDQPLLGGMLGDLLAGAPGITFVGRAGTVAEARRVFLPGTVDVLTMDIELPDGNGVSLGVSLRRAQPGLGIVLLSAYDLMDMLLEMPADVRDGWSYLSKTSSLTREVLLEAVRASARGETMLDPELIDRTRPRAGSSLESLTDRQYAVLQLLATGRSNTGIASRLGIAEKSVQNHLTAIYAALGIEHDTSSNPRVSAVLALLAESGRLS
jgi:DNA-binding NarL/FixJ family response regulator